MGNTCFQLKYRAKKLWKFAVGLFCYCCCQIIYFVSFMLLLRLYWWSIWICSYCISILRRQNSELSPLVLLYWLLLQMIRILKAEFTVYLYFRDGKDFGFMGIFICLRQVKQSFVNLLNNSFIQANFLFSWWSEKELSLNYSINTVRLKLFLVHRQLVQF